MRHAKLKSRSSDQTPNPTNYYWGIMAATVVSIALGLLYATGATALDNGVGKLPALGFNSRFILKCSDTSG